MDCGFGGEGAGKGFGDCVGCAERGDGSGEEDGVCLGWLAVVFVGLVIIDMFLE